MEPFVVVNCHSAQCVVNSCRLVSILSFRAISCYFLSIFVSFLVISSYFLLISVVYSYFLPFCVICYYLLSFVVNCCHFLLFSRRFVRIRAIFANSRHLLSFVVIFCVVFLPCLVFSYRFLSFGLVCFHVMLFFVSFLVIPCLFLPFLVILCHLLLFIVNVEQT